MRHMTEVQLEKQMSETDLKDFGYCNLSDANYKIVMSNVFK